MPPCEQIQNEIRDYMNVDDLRLVQTDKIKTMGLQGFQECNKHSLVRNNIINDTGIII